MSTALQKRDFYSYIMMIGHLCADLCFFALTAMTPFLVVQKGIILDMAVVEMTAITTKTTQYSKIKQ